MQTALFWIEQMLQQLAERLYLLENEIEKK